MAVNTDTADRFFSVLAAPGRSPEIPESADVYGWLCGSWDLDVLHYRGIDVGRTRPEGRSPRRARARGTRRPGRVDHAATRGSPRRSRIRR